jgi:hypothetical protein
LARSSLISNRSGAGRRARACALAFALLCAAAGCSHVAPYEREYLARPGIDAKEREALRMKFYSHVYEAREGAMAGEEHAGGGCGCN